nr:putative nuclease HARBI1 [Oryza sativa Japonica Group]
MQLMSMFVLEVVPLLRVLTGLWWLLMKFLGEEYLRTPNENDIARLLAQGEERGFPGMLGSLDCIHWQWKNCPTAWQGQYKGKEGVPTIVLEAVASRDRRFWHAFFGSPGSHNDINVLQRSPLFAKLAEGKAPKVNYSINGHDYTMGYYLADGIYPSWATLVKSIKLPQGNKRKYFSKAQEAARKDVEQAFGVLQARFSIVRGPARFWKALTLNQIMRACIIMNNMIVEDERDGDFDLVYDEMGEQVGGSHERTTNFNDFISQYEKIQDKEVHNQLREDLIEHLWNHHADRY